MAKKPKVFLEMAKNGSNERLHIQTILAALKTRTELGLKLVGSPGYDAAVGAEIWDVRLPDGNNRAVHYDLKLFLRDTRMLYVEIKCSQTNTPIQLNDPPWKCGVQFHNGPCTKYSLCKRYAQLWYDIHIQSGDLHREFALEAALPTFDEWYRLDVCRQTDPTTPFGLELKAKVRAHTGGSLLAQRAPVVAAFEMTPADEASLMSEVYAEAKNAFNDKDCWLTVHGNLEGEFNAAWFPKFTLTPIVSVQMTKKQDIHFVFTCEDGFKLKSILRWGKGAGFSCLRMDLK